MSTVVISSFIASALASSITYPHDVLRARLQDNRNHSSLLTITRDLIKKEGVRSLWSGFKIHFLRLIPATCLSFVSYELLFHQLNQPQ